MTKALTYRISIVLLMLALCLTLVSCSKDSSYNDNYSGGSAAVGDAAEGDYGYGKNELPSTSPDDTTEDESIAQKIIRTVDMAAETKEFDKAITEIKAALTAAGGYEESFRTTGRGYGDDDLARRATMTLRIPADKLDAFLGEVGGMVHVTSQNAALSNVTQEYYDIEARLKVLESEKTAYEAMLKKANSTSELLEIQDRLYDVITEIEAFETRLRVLDSQVSYSTVYLSLNEVVEYTPTRSDDSFVDRITDAFYDSWERFAVNGQDFLVWLVDAIPTILVLLVIGGIILWIVIATNRRHAPKRVRPVPPPPAQPAPKAEETAEAPKEESK